MPLVAYNEQQDTIKGIWPLHLGIFKVFKSIRFTTILFVILFAIFFGLTFIENEILSYITGTIFYTYLLLGLIAIILLGLFIMFILYIGWLKPVKFDIWVYEICSKRLGTDIVFYTKNRLFIKYDIASAKEVDKKDFVTEMSDKSLYYSYFYIKTYPDEQLLEIEITPKQPIPDVSFLDHKDDTKWNLVPLGLAINNSTLKVSAIPWTLNTEEKDPNMIQTVPSVTICISGSTGTGKSVIQNGIIGHFSRFSDRFQVCGVDMKRVEFNNLLGVKSVKGVALEITAAANLIASFQSIMMARFQFMTDNRVNNIFKLKNINVPYYRLFGQDYQFDEMFTVIDDLDQNSRDYSKLLKLYPDGRGQSILTIEQIYEKLQNNEFSKPELFEVKGYSKYITKDSILKLEDREFKPKSLVLVIDEMNELKFSHRLINNLIKLLKPIELLENP